MKKCSISLLVLISFLVGCNTAKESVEVKDQRRFETKPSTPIPAPTVSDIDYTKTIVFVSDDTLQIGQETKIKLVTTNSEGEEIPISGQTVLFTFIGTGTSVATIGPTVDEGNGVYSATLTGLTPGSFNSIAATINATPVSDMESVRVDGGPFYRDITFDMATLKNEYQVRVVLNSLNFSYANAGISGDDLLFFDHNMDALSYYIETWDPSGDSIVWVQTLTAGTPSIRMYYGDTSLVASSSQEDTFSYSIPFWNWVELSYSMGSSTMSVASYTNANVVTLTRSASTVPIAVSPNTPTTVTSIVKGLISALGPISARYERDNRGGDSISSLALATTKTGYSMSRGTDDWDFYNPNATAANVSIENYDSSGALLGTTSFSVAANSHHHVDYNVSKMGIVESDIPVVGMYYAGTSDGALMMPASKDIIIPLSKTATLGIIEDGTVGKIYKSDGTITIFSGNKGETVTITGGGNQHLGAGARVISNKDVIAYGQADSDGSESVSFWPVDEMDRDYIIPNDSQYFTILCTDEVNLTVYNPDGSVNETTSCFPAFENPGLVQRGAASGINYNAGTRIAGDANFYVWYEYGNQDETNILSLKQGRVYSYPAPVPSVGVEQIP